MIRHVFLYKVAPGEDPEEIAEILNTLPARIPHIRHWELGPHAGEPDGNGEPWDYALTCDFDSMQDLEAYSNDEYHLGVVEQLLPRFADRAVVDFDIGGAR